MVRMRGLEPPRLATPDPKSGASANSATSAYLVQKLLYRLKQNISTVSINNFEKSARILWNMLHQQQLIAVFKKNRSKELLNRSFGLLTLFTKIKMKRFGEMVKTKGSIGG